MHWKDRCWSWNSSTFVIWCEKLPHWKRLSCWESLKVGEGDNIWWFGWMASLTWWTWWTWVWVSSGNWWWIGKTDVLQSMGLQSWTQLIDLTELNTGCEMTLIPRDPNCHCGHQSKQNLMGVNLSTTLAQVHLIVSPGCSWAHSIAIFQVPKCIIRIDILSSWQHPNIGSLNCGVVLWWESPNGSH